MNTKLITTLAVVDLAASASIAVAHGLNAGGAPIVPDVIVVPDGVDATADDTEVTFTNNGSADVSFVSLVTRWHSIARELGGAVPNLTPQPYVIKSAAPAAGGITPVAVGFWSDLEFTPPQEFIANGCTIAHTGPGAWTVTLDAVPADPIWVVVSVASFYIPLVGLSFFNNGDGTIDVIAKQSNGSVIDVAFTIVVSSAPVTNTGP